MDQLGALGPLGANVPVTSQGGLPSGLPVSLAPTLPGAPGSPAKAFPGLGNPAAQLGQQQFNPVQNLASQLQSNGLVFVSLQPLPRRVM